MICGIYLIENKETGQKYVGQSINIEKRWKEHLRGKDIGRSRIDNAINKHGGDKFTLSVITELPVNKDMLNMHEKYWIKFYNTFKDKNHYNLTEGGDGVGSGENHPKYWKGKNLSEEHKKNIGKGNKDKIVSDETKKKMSKSMSGENHWNYGNPNNYHHSDETKNKIGKGNKDKIVSDETKMKMSKTHNTTGYYRVYKRKDKRLKQGFIWVYRYYDKNGKRQSISSVSIDKLEKNVKAKGLKWEKLKGGD